MSPPLPLTVGFGDPPSSYQQVDMVVQGGLGAVLQLNCCRQVQAYGSDAPPRSCGSGLQLGSALPLSPGSPLLSSNPPAIPSVELQHHPTMKVFFRRISILTSAPTSIT